MTAGQDTPPPAIIDAARAVERAVTDGTAQVGPVGARLARIRAAIRADWPALGWALNDLHAACRANPPAAQPGAVTPEHYRQNTDATANRQQKASRLADWGEAHGVTPSQLLALEAAVRRGVERTQGIRRCSDDETWPHAATLLADRIDIANARRGATRGPTGRPHG